jgi:hypothetical protein
MNRKLFTAFCALLISVIPAYAVFDENGNGASDIWERAFNNGALFSTFDPAADPDADGWTNAQEALAGTNPFEAITPLSIVQVDVVKNPGFPSLFALAWKCPAGKTATLFVSPDLSLDSWSDVDVFPSGGQTTTIAMDASNTDGSSPSHLFWRVRIDDVDSTGNGLSDYEELALGMDSGAADLNANGIPDAWEAAYAGTFAVYPPVLAARILPDHSVAADIRLFNDTGAAVTCLPSLTGNTTPAYDYTDSLTGDAIYSWEEISTTGTLLAGVSAVDDGSEEAPLSGFQFPFYGKIRHRIFVSSNGFLSFGEGGEQTANRELGGAGFSVDTPPFLIAPLWDDLKPATGGSIFYQHIADRFIIQFQDVPRYGSTSGILTFQVVLYDDGRIRFQYKEITAPAIYASVGIENRLYQKGFTIAHDQAYLTSGMAVEIRPEKTFFTVPPATISVPSHSVTSLTGNFDSLRLAPSVSYASLLITPSGSGNPAITIPTRLAVFLPDGDGDGMPNFYETRHGLDLAADDSALDKDGDTLTNLAEYQLGTSASVRDTDMDLLPDDWEVFYGLDPLEPYGSDGKDGDIDTDGFLSPGDGLANLAEYLNGTSPLLADTDGDGESDLIEIGAGRDPLDPLPPVGGAGGEPLPDQTVEVPFSIYGDYASWKMIVKGMGPRDHRTLMLVTGGVGEYGSESLILKRNNRYEITLEHIGSKQGESPPPWYCWEAQIESKPSAQTFENYSTERTDEGDFFSIGDGHWLVDNRDGLLTPHIHSHGTNVTAGKKAYLVPVAIKDNLIATGVDDTSVSVAPDVAGYVPEYWLMAPIAGPPPPSDYSDLMKFVIPLSPPAPLFINCDHALPDPTAIALDNTPAEVLWRGFGANETSDNIPEFKIGDHQDIVDLAIRVKTMKYRKVTVHVYPLRKNSSARNVPLPEHDLNQTKDLENYLNTTYGYQVNVWFDVIYHEQTDYDYDPDSNGFVGLPDSAIQNLANHNDYNVSDKDVRIFLLDSIYIRNVNGHEDNSRFLGYTYPGGDFSIIWTGSGQDSPTHEQVQQTIAHEIGHIFRLEHPRQGGPAPLDGTDQTLRLMYYRSENKLLVKK